MPALLPAVGMTAEVTGSHWLIRRNAKLAWKQSRSTFFLDGGVTSKRDLRSICTIKKSLACIERKGLGLNIRVEPMLDGTEKIGELAYCFSGLETLITTAVLVSVQDEGFVGAPTRVAS
jgi:hypothetical protein